MNFMDPGKATNALLALDEERDPKQDVGNQRL